jgi:hypothetical protein
LKQDRYENLRYCENIYFDIQCQWDSLIHSPAKKIPRLKLHTLALKVTLLGLEHPENWTAKRLAVSRLSPEIF